MEEKKCKLLLKFVRFEFAITCILLIISIFIVGHAVSGASGDPMSVRMEKLDFEIENVLYHSLASSMMRNKDYEEAYEYLWERCVMNQYMFRYRVYQSAVDRGLSEYEEQAKYYGEKLEQYCKNPTYPENAPYAKHFLMRAGLAE